MSGQVRTPWAVRRIGLGRGQLLFGRMHEDVSVDEAVLGGARRVFAIASAGDTALWLGRQGRQVTAVDVRPAQVAYVQARAAGHGVRDGSVDHLLGVARLAGRLGGCSREALRRFLLLEDPEAQTRAFDHLLGTGACRALLAVALHPRVLRLGYAAGFVSTLPQPFAPRLWRWLRAGFAAHPNRCNPYAWRLLLGTDPPEHPDPPGPVPRWSCARSATPVTRTRRAGRSATAHSSGARSSSRPPRTSRTESTGRTDVVRTHPFPMTARFRDLLVLTYAFPAPTLQPLTAALALDQRQGHGFVTIALVDMAGLRPSRLPAALGLDVRCIGYRIVVRASSVTGRTRRGLYVLRTEMDRWPLQVGTRLLTHYRSARARISWQRDGDRLQVQARSRRGVTDLHLIADLGRRPAQPPAGSPFSSWEAARPFTGPLPWTFAPNPVGDAAVTVKGVRERWNPRPLQVEQADVALFRQLPFATATPRLAAAFQLHDLAYAWTAGTVEPLLPHRRQGAR